MTAQRVVDRTESNFERTGEQRWMWVSYVVALRKEGGSKASESKGGRISHFEPCKNLRRDNEMCEFNPGPLQPLVINLTGGRCAVWDIKDRVKKHKSKRPSTNVGWPNNISIKSTVGG